jgi:hypothetical protein
MAADTDHAKILERLGDTHTERVAESLSILESRIAGAMDQLPVRDGKLFDLAAAINIRQTILAEMQDTFLTEVDSIIRDYDEAIDATRTMLAEYGDFADIPPTTINALKTLTFQGFEDVASTFVDELANEVYQNTLTGRTRAESVRAMRGKLNGVYQQSDQDEIQRLVDVAAGGGAAAEEAVERLHKVYAADRLGRNMRRYASQQVRDSLNQFNASINTAIGMESGVARWKYVGSNVVDTRDFCVRTVGKTFTEEEIRETWASEEWQGKAPGDPFIVRGGYNCRHFWRPVFD